MRTNKPMKIYAEPVTLSRFDLEELENHRFELCENRIPHDDGMQFDDDMFSLSIDSSTF